MQNSHAENDDALHPLREVPRWTGRVTSREVDAMPEIVQLRGGTMLVPARKCRLMRNDDEIRALLSRLARRHPSGGTVIERAAIVADGADSAAVVAWILDHAGEPEAAADTSSKRGLHSPRLSGSMGSERAPARYVLPAGALN